MYPATEFSLSEEASSTDAMAEYTFRSKREEYRKNKNVEETMPIILERNNQR